MRLWGSSNLLLQTRKSILPQSHLELLLEYPSEVWDVFGDSYTEKLEIVQLETAILVSGTREALEYFTNVEASFPYSCNKPFLNNLFTRTVNFQNSFTNSNLACQSYKRLLPGTWYLPTYSLAAEKKQVYYARLHNNCLGLNGDLCWLNIIENSCCSCSYFNKTIHNYFISCSNYAQIGRTTLPIFQIL